MLAMFLEAVSKPTSWQDVAMTVAVSACTVLVIYIMAKYS